MINELQHFKTIDLRHLYVEENEIRLILLDGLYALKTVIAFLKGFYLRKRFQVFPDHQPG